MSRTITTKTVEKSDSIYIRDSYFTQEIMLTVTNDTGSGGAQKVTINLTSRQAYEVAQELIRVAQSLDLRDDQEVNTRRQEAGLRSPLPPS